MSEADAIKRATADALRTAAGWGRYLNPLTLESVAKEVEAMDPADSMCCPVCEEVICDSGCPLEPIRAPETTERKP